MDTGSNERYSFIVEWLDVAASLIRQYQLLYYGNDGTVEMHDLKNRRVFLKRSKVDTISKKDLFLGATINVHARQLKVVDFCDDFTRQKLSVKAEKTLAIIKPDGYNYIGKIVDKVLEQGFRIANMRMVKLTRGEAQSFYAEHQGKEFFDKLVQFMTSDVAVALELVADNAVAAWRSMIGPTNSFRAKEESPKSLRALFGSDETRNAVHGSASPMEAEREIDFFFGSNSRFSTTATFSNCTLAIVKPHAFKEGSAGKIIDKILEEGFEVSAMQTFALDRPNAEEFLEVYKGVMPEYTRIVDELCLGESLVMEIRSENAVETFRALCGPHDPEIGRILRPNTIRAKFGKDKVKNAIHCTDLSEDGNLEVEYFFKILQ
uniref:DM10 domain-containing protein n=1 Tax=Palpitomonas bilix TaxID=652834 RepID=A0A7S3GCI2_9EUKA|mmetsp:Transcript_43434/g.113049  ORF Transcript_43434/g.113049 Transcript_43434/m.113049 type:complete len:376 (+) Transcript_43434:156-1283(+)